MVAIFLGSSIHGQDIPHHPIFSYDKLLHGTEYAILGVFLYVAFGRFWPAVLLASLYAASDEFHQLFVPGRNCDPFDWIADTIGGTLGALIWRIRVGRKR